MPAADDLMKSRAAIHDHDPQAAGIRIELFLIQNHCERQFSFLPSHRGPHLRNDVFLGEIVTAADDLLEPLSITHDFHDQHAPVWLMFPLVTDVAVLHAHESASAIPIAYLITSYDLLIPAA